MPCSWEGNRRSGIALATRQTLVVLHLRAQTLLWSMVDFTHSIHSTVLTLLRVQPRGTGVTCLMRGSITVPLRQPGALVVKARTEDSPVELGVSKSEMRRFLPSVL